MSQKPKRPIRKKKSDRLISSQCTKEEAMVDMAVGPFDRAVIEMDRKWGVDVLPELVSPETAAKFGSAFQKLNEAIDKTDPQETATRAAVCIRGLQAMDREATERGAQPASDEVWHIEADGKTFGLMRDARAWQAVQDRHPNLTLITEREMVHALEMYRNSVAHKALELAKEHFPSAELTKVKTKSYEDDIPF